MRPTILFGTILFSAQLGCQPTAVTPHATAAAVQAADQTVVVRDVLASEIEFEPAIAGVPNVPLLGQVWGDLQLGHSGYFLRFDAGFAGFLHTHSADYRGVVLSGQIVNAQKGEASPKHLGPGSYWSQPKDLAHITSCDPGADCLVYVAMEGPFDVLPAE
jgi:hypothetical protein